MKNLKETILEKLVFNKHTKSKDYNFNIFCKELQFDNNENIKKLYELYLYDCDNIIGTKFNGELISTNFELMFMLVAMMVDDDELPSSIYRIGTKIYNGKNNPYDFSWFEVEDSNERTVLDIMSELYGLNKYFSDTFNFIYKIIKYECKDTKKAIDGIWILCEKI